jgi:rod shape-determining protein MreC
MIRRTPRSRFTVVVLLMVCLTLITIDTKANHGGVLNAARARARDLLVPAQSGLDGVAGPVADFADAIVNAGDIKAENRRLREQNAALQGRVLQLSDAEREKQALLDLNKLDVVKDIQRVSARVVNLAPSNLQLTIEIDRGTEAGVAKDMPVTIGSGLIGRVDSATARRAMVRLITDPSVNVGVRIPSNVSFSVAGTGATTDLTAELVSPDKTLNVGDVVVTSGQGERFPAGIPVGTVSLARVQPGVAFQEVRVRPAVDFRRVEFVQVLLWQGGVTTP